MGAPLSHFSGTLVFQCRNHVQLYFFLSFRWGLSFNFPPNFPSSSTLLTFSFTSFPFNPTAFFFLSVVYYAFSPLIDLLILCGISCVLSYISCPRLFSLTFLRRWMFFNSNIHLSKILFFFFQYRNHANYLALLCFFISGYEFSVIIIFSHLQKDNFRVNILQYIV